MKKFALHCGRAVVFNGAVLSVLFCLSLAGSLVAQSIPGFPTNKVLNAVPTIAALEALPVTIMSSGTAARVLGYYTAGDTPPHEFTLSTSACSLSSGAGDGGSQIPSNTSGYCWILAPTLNLDPRIWGALPGGTDPNYTSGDTGNALAFNNMFAYVISLKHALAGGEQLVDVSSGGLQYGVNYPVIMAPSYIHFHDVALFPLSSTNYTCGSATSSTAVLEVTGAGYAVIDHIDIDENRLPIYGIGDGATGTAHYDNILVEHWEGSCGSVTTPTGQGVTSGSAVVTLSASAASLGLQVGMVSRGNSSAGIPDRTVIMDIGTSPNTITLSKLATATTASTALTFYNDSMGMVTGFNQANTGGTYANLNLLEWKNADSEKNVPGDRYGFAWFYQFGSNDIYDTGSKFIDGVASVFDGPGGLYMHTDQINNSLWSTPEPNAPAMLIAPEAGPTTLDGINTDTPIEIFDTSNGQPKLRIGAPKMNVASGISLNPQALVQVYNNVTGADGTRMVVDPFAIPLSTGYPMLASYGPGTFAPPLKSINVDNVVTGGPFYPTANIAAIGSAFTNSNNVAALITDGTNSLQFPVYANSTYTVRCHLVYQMSSIAAGALYVQWSGSVASVTGILSTLNYATNTTVFNTSTVTLQNTNMGGTAAAVANTNLSADVDMTLVTNTNAGTIGLYAKSGSVSSTLTIEPQSSCTIH